MAKKNSKSKGRGSKPNRKVSTKMRKTPYDKGYDAINEILRENVYQQCTWNVSPSRNIVQEYADALGELSSQHSDPQQHNLPEEDAVDRSQADATARRDDIVACILHASKKSQQTQNQIPAYQAG